jgi:hypothetical protein
MGGYRRNRRTRAELDQVDEAIIEAIGADAPVTLRGVFYRVVSMGVIGKTELDYRLVGRRLLKLRREHEVNYADITDGTRWVNKPTTWADLDEMLEDAAASYRRALWHDQPIEVQIFTEKDAISGVIQPVTDQWDVALGVVRGYASESFAWSVAQSVCDARQAGIDDVCLYQLGDHDPSGVDAWRDFTDKVAGFAIEHYSNVEWLHFERLAVTEQQIADWQLPTRPTKATDTRSAGFTGGSVEVDAIPAPQLRRIVEQAITQHINQEHLRITQAAEQSERDILARMIGGAG